MSLIDEAQMRSEAAQRPRTPKYPAGWDPHVIEAADEAVAVSGTFTTPDRPGEDDLIRAWHLDPAVWQIIDGTLVVNRWQQRPTDDDWLYQYKARLQRRIPTELAADLTGLVKRIRTRRPATKVPTGTKCFVVAIGDTQIGKGDGDGTPGTVDRWLGSLDRTEARIKELRRNGWDIGRIALPFMGDLREGCTGNYPAQKFTTDLTIREQEGLLEELIFETIHRLSRLAPEMEVDVVPGNHGENRDGGKAYTLPSDNADIAVVERVHRGIRRNENHAFDHVQFVYPAGQELTVCRDLCGVGVGFAHGHQFGTSGAPAVKAQNWWKNMAHGEQDIGDCRILISAHYHHLLVAQSGRKTHIQIPSLDGGSRWWENATGQSSPPGMVSMVVGEGVGPHGCGWDELRVL